MENWLYRTFICGHTVTGQIKAEKRRYSRKKHYRFCEKCGKKFYID